MRKCVYRKQLDLETLVATRGPNFPLGRLEGRLMCPAAGIGGSRWSLSRRAMLRRWGVGDGKTSMAAMTYYVALAFKRSEENGDIVAGDPKEARSAEQAIRMAGRLAVVEGHCGAIAFSRTGDPALGDFEDAVILKAVGEVDVGLSDWVGGATPSWR